MNAKCELEFRSHWPTLRCKVAQCDMILMCQARHLMYILSLKFMSQHMSKKSGKHGWMDRGHRHSIMRSFFKFACKTKIPQCLVSISLKFLAAASSSINTPCLSVCLSVCLSHFCVNFVYALPGAVLLRSWWNLVGAHLGLRSRPSSFVGDVAR